MSFSTLTQFDRGAIYHLLNIGYSQNKIASALNVSKSTISYELKRVQPYNPILAQADAEQQRHHSGRKSILTPMLKRLIENHLRLTHSPDEVAHELRLCTSSIYNWIYSGQINFKAEQLPDKGQRHKHQDERRGSFQVGKTIENRPQAINDRSEFGHWEMDTVLSSRGGSKTCLATFVERKSRLVWMIKIPNRSQNAMNNAIETFIRTFGPAVKSFTADHGKEFSGYQLIEDTYQREVYFCHPYSPWERGTNEYFNRKIRWFFPKKTNFAKVTEESIIEATELINNRPLKILNWKTAIETFRELFSKCSN
ncbi:IS30 family transposase [Pediococcus siamensis]|uniref:IS30 family transposase n=1 Tax=Pediococcus siamensis TaxID=381829 RepID=UPI0039A1EC70